MDDGMAVWAYWPQVPDRMQMVLRPYLCDWDDAATGKRPFSTR